ncbi:hypothetical protein M8C21_013903 [Ambrosia artemisiifolia]|uniref:Uncharacterized protein n=1 Tax=Ambrosia artemisiifolia TaxID=4212 RepID=A0AAD5G1Z5_AMBAR|nr:hypothetical protein M8C21_013903 [Ambrosia artemisiifolia]
MVGISMFSRKTMLNLLKKIGKRCTVVGAGRFHQYNSYIKGIKVAAQMTYILVAIVVGRKTIFCGVPWDDYIGNSPQWSLANYIRYH